MEKLFGKTSQYRILSLLFLTFGLLFPMIAEEYWFDVVVKIRTSINTGDSGNILLASGYSSILFALQCTMLFIGLNLTKLLCYRHIKKSKDIDEVHGEMMKTHYGLMVVELILFMCANAFVSNMYSIPWEYLTTLMAVIFAEILIESDEEEYSFLKTGVVSIQVFFAFHWLNIMPILSDYGFGISDIPISIKLIAEYLESSSVLNFMGGFFFFPTFAAAVLTSVLFQIHDKNIKMVTENYEKEREIQAIRAKAMENRIYEEINSLAHDLKTPLVTIRGLNSLFALSKDVNKLIEYSGRIEGAVEKMSEMISSFLYGSSRQVLRPADLIRYIQAQIPIEDEKLKVDIKIGEDLPCIYVNKVRVVRALINLVENSIVVPKTGDMKLITIETIKRDNYVKILVSDNGVGIDSDIMDDIWEIGHSTNNTTGLGLPFAKQIVEENEGTIEIESTKWVGTTVTVSFPAMSEDNI